MRSIMKLSLVVAALALTGTALQAQTNNASITATASVQTPINVVGAQQLSFGNVFPGVYKTIAATDLTNAGRFDVTGQASSPVTISFTLPAWPDVAPAGVREICSRDRLIHAWEH